ncbi:MAG TPA: LuxR C-terminal-related transcriptional regulator, partial [Pseudomonadales bacterium]
VVNCHRVNDISSSLHLSPKTVNSYRYRIFEKLNVKSDVELALLAVRHGMIVPHTIDGSARAVVEAPRSKAG